MAGGNKHHRRKKRGAEAVVSAPSAPVENANKEVEIEYVVELPENIDEEYAQAFNRLAGGLVQNKEEQEDNAATTKNKAEIADNILDSLFSNAQEEEEASSSSSKKQLRKRMRPSVAQLKQIAPLPALVEVHDVTSPDPELLVFLKSRRGAVQVPRHWSSSTKYLAGKRSLDKKPYQLPDYIVQTGIGKMRDAADDSQDSLQKRMRDRARPKLGQITVDYHVLRDAFFKYQTKPVVTKHGELYYEGKEIEKDRSSFIPGVFSEELKAALGMATVERDGAHASSICPPPWLANMQRFGPPPSYPGFAFPGVNAPLPPGAQYGPTGWGKPPVDHFGRGLFGDVMGISKDAALLQELNAQPVKLWGGFTYEEEEVEEEEDAARKRARLQEEGEEEEVGGEEGEVEVGEVREIESFSLAKPPAQAAAAAAAASLVPDEAVDLRKRPFRVLEQQSMAPGAMAASGTIFGASHQYTTKEAPVLMAIAPEDAEMDAKQLAKRLEEEAAAARATASQHVPVGLAPGAGTLDISQDLKKKQAKSSSKKEKFKF